VIQFPFVVVVQWAGGEFCPARGDDFLELLDALPGIQSKPAKPWIADVFRGTYRIGIIDVRTGEVFDDAGIVVQQIGPEIAAGYDERGG
jgi:hypothetical protein